MIEKNIRAKTIFKYMEYNELKQLNPYLDKGEVIFAWIDVGTNSEGDQLPHKVVMKVGDGVHRFNELEILSASSTTLD